MIELLRTTDPVKRSAVRALLAAADVVSFEFDAAAGSMWQAAIPVRLMVDDHDLARARTAMRQAGFRACEDGDWDLKRPDAGQLT
ncbi:MAG TPA: DUF2007 domain-containing protein [Caulobacteraceae bacterium]